MATAKTSVSLVNTAWTSLGNGPLRVALTFVATGGVVDLRVADAQPALSDAPHASIGGVNNSASFEDVTNAVWGLVRYPNATATVDVTTGISVAGGSGSGGGGAVTIVDGGAVTLGSTTDDAYATGVAAGSGISIWKYAAKSLASILAKLNAGIGVTGTFWPATQPVVQGGSVGTDYSANEPTLPNVGANFGSSGLYANYALIRAVPALSTRNNVDVENTSGAQIVVLRDDGTAASGAAPNNASIIALGGGSGVGSQGGSWTSQTFKGRLQIYAASSTAVVSIFVD